MSSIEVTKNKIQEIFLKTKFSDIRKPHIEALTMNYFVKSKEFLFASDIIEKELNRPLMPYLHLQAQCVELAIKGYLLSCNFKPKKTHDLVKLTKVAERLGLILTQIEASSIVLLNHYFFEDLITKSKFKTRYPTLSQETVGGPVPEQCVVKNIYESIFSQAKDQCSFLNLLSNA